MANTSNPKEPDDLSALKSLLSPLRKSQPTGEQMQSWLETMELHSTTSHTKRTSNWTIGFLVAGNMLALLLVAAFFPIESVIQEGHIISFEINEHSPSAKMALVNLPWISEASWSYSKPTNRHPDPALPERTKLHLVFLGKEEKMIESWANQVLSLESVQKVRIIPLMVKETRPLISRVTAAKDNQSASHLYVVHQRVTEHLIAIDHNPFSKLYPADRDMLASTVFDSGNGNSSPLLPVEAQSVNFIK
jgi:hypothetical protein